MSEFEVFNPDLMSNVKKEDFDVVDSETAFEHNLPPIVIPLERVQIECEHEEFKDIPFNFTCETSCSTSNTTDEPKSSEADLNLITKSLICPICTTPAFRNVLSVSFHILRHYDLKLYTCSECDQKFATNWQLYYHYKLRHPPKALMLLRRSHTLNKWQIASHRRKTSRKIRHPEKNNIRCPICQIQYLSIPQLAKHLIQTHRHRVIKATVNRNIKHLRQASKASRRFACPNCEFGPIFECDALSDMCRHLIDQHSDSIATHHNHSKSEHSQKYCIWCPFCLSRCFKCSLSFCGHILEHFKVRLFKCDDCSSEFYSQREFNRHKKDSMQFILSKQIAENQVAQLFSKAAEQNLFCLKSRQCVTQAHPLKTENKLAASKSKCCSGYQDRMSEMSFLVNDSVKLVKMGFKLKKDSMLAETNLIERLHCPMCEGFLPFSALNTHLCKHLPGQTTKRRLALHDQTAPICVLSLSRPGGTASMGTLRQPESNTEPDDSTILASFVSLPKPVQTPRRLYDHVVPGCNVQKYGALLSTRVTIDQPKSQQKGAIPKHVTRPSQPQTSIVSTNVERPVRNIVAPVREPHIPKPLMSAFRSFQHPVPLQPRPPSCVRKHTIMFPYRTVRYRPFAHRVPPVSTTSNNIETLLKSEPDVNRANQLANQRTATQ